MARIYGLRFRSVLLGEQKRVLPRAVQKMRQHRETAKEDNLKTKTKKAIIYLSIDKDGVAGVVSSRDYGLESLERL